MKIELIKLLVELEKWKLGYSSYKFNKKSDNQVNQVINGSREAKIKSIKL